MSEDKGHLNFALRRAELPLPPNHMMRIRLDLKLGHEHWLVSPSDNIWFSKRMGKVDLIENNRITNGRLGLIS
jgi:hypothetical protein